MTGGELSKLTSEDALLLENNTHEMHMLRTRQLLPEILEQVIVAFVICFFLTIGLRVLIEIVHRYFMSHETGTPKFLKQSDTERWLYTTFWSSVFYSQWLFVICIIATMECEPPASLQESGKIDGLLHKVVGDSMFTHKFCRDRPNDKQMLANATVIGVMFNDLLIQMLLVRDFKTAAAKQTYMHHVLAIFGAVCGLYFGRFYCPMSNVVCLTELSTLFVDFRWLLYYHSLSDSSAYFYNGLIMTSTFAILRIIFMPYAFIAGGVFANMETDYSRDTDLVFYLGQFSVVMYFLLVCLNFVWFKKMVAGSIKHWNKHVGGAEQ